MARPTRELTLTRNEFYEMMAERLPRCLAILDEHLASSSLRSEQRWAVHTIFDKILPTLIAAPSAQATLADALKTILTKNQDLSGAPEAPSIQDAEVVPDGEAKFLVPKNESGS